MIVVDDDPPVAVHDRLGSEIIQPDNMLIFDIVGKVITTWKVEKPSYYEATAIRICGVEIVNVARCRPFEDGLYACNFAVVHVRVKADTTPVSCL